MAIELSSEKMRSGRRELIRRDPNFAEAHNNLGLVLLQTGDLHSAQAEFAEALRLKPGHAEARSNLALAFHQDGKEAESHAEFEKALRYRTGIEKCVASITARFHRGTKSNFLPYHLQPDTLREERQ